MIDKIIKINNVPLPKVKKYTVGYDLLWADAERNMAGSLNANLIGEFPKIELEFPDGLTQSDVDIICNALSSAFFTVEYWDSRLNKYTSGQFYRNDYNLELMDKYKKLYYGIKVNLIPLEPRR